MANQSIYPYIDPFLYGPIKYRSNSDGDRRMAHSMFLQLESELKKFPEKSNQPFKETFFFYDLSIILRSCFLISGRPDDDFMRPIIAAVHMTLTYYPYEINDLKDCIATLIEYGAEVNYRYKGFTPILLIALRHTDVTIAIIDLLLRNGANINDKSSNDDDITGLSVLHTAIQAKPLSSYTYSYNTYNDRKDLYVPIISHLLSKGANINAVDNKGNTVLHYAVRLQLESVIPILLSNNIDINIKNNENQTALDITITKGFIGIKAILLNPQSFITHEDIIVNEPINEKE